MRLVILTFADRVEFADDGKTSIIGLVDRVTAPGFPTRVTFALMARFAISPEEFGHTVAIDIFVRPPDGPENHLIHEPGAVVPTGEPGGPAYWDRVWRFADTEFPKAGPYEFVLRMDGSVVGELGLSVVETAPA